MVFQSVRSQALILLLLLLLAPMLSRAQYTTDTLKADLQPVHVSALRTNISSEDAPLSLSILTRSSTEINSETALTLNQIISQLPGLWINDRENYALGESIAIRGLGWRAAFGVRGIQVIMDDIPLTVADGQSMLTTVDPAFVSDIELIRGPASAYWGNSSGGVLYLSTPSPPKMGSSVRARLITGSYGLQKGGLTLAKSFGSHSITGYASHLTEEGYRNHSSVNIFRSGFKGSVNINSVSQLEYMGAFVAMPDAQHPGGLTKQQANADPRQANSSFEEAGAGKAVYQGQAGINYYRDTDLGFITLTGYGIYRDLYNPLSYSIGVIDLERWAGGLRGTLQRDFGSLKTNFGFDSKWQFDDRTEYAYDNGEPGPSTVDQLETVSNQAFFATSSYQLKNLNFLGGLRFDWLTFVSDAQHLDSSGSRTFHALSPSFGLSYSMGDIKAYSSISTSFEAPTTTELVNRPDGGNGFNPELSPEHTIGWELGAKGLAFNQKAKIDFALYRLWIQNLLFPYQLEENGPTFYRNQGQTIHSGFEGAVSVTLSNRITTQLTYNYTHAVFDEGMIIDTQSLRGKRVPGVPEHRVEANLQYIDSFLLLDLRYNYVSSFSVNNLNTEFNGAYGVWNANLSLVDVVTGEQIKVQPFLDLNNIFDTQYNGSVTVNAFGGRYYEPAAGRNWQLGIAVEF